MDSASNVKTLVGVRRFVSRKGQSYAVLQLSSPFSQRELSNGCLGTKVEDQFVPENLLDKVDTLVLNKPISFTYDVDGGRAYVVDFATKEK